MTNHQRISDLRLQIARLELALGALTDDSEPLSHVTSSDGFIHRHPSQIEREKQECAYYLRVCWPAICAEEPTPDSIPEEQTPP